jgi:hypothetical protein
MSDSIESMAHAESGGGGLAETPGLPNDVRLKLIEMTGNLGELEADRLWRRFGIMLALNASLIAIVSYTLGQALFFLTALIGSFGGYLSVVWYRIVMFSQFAEERWRADMSYLMT